MKKKRKKGGMSPVSLDADGPMSKKKKTKKAEVKGAQIDEDTSSLVEAMEQNQDVIVLEASEGIYKKLDLSSKDTIDSEVRARRLLRQIIAPISIRRFYDEISEQRALYISGRGQDYWGDLMTVDDVFRVLVETEAKVGVDVDVCRYENGCKRNLSPPTERVTLAWTRKQFENGATVRLRCPQQHLDRVHTLCQGIEDEFGADVSANAYLTPGNGEQGFAPHYDDVDVFILQLHGNKRWQLWTPQKDHMKLPRFSSQDYTPDFMKADEQYRPSDTIEVKPGDVLYLPRGFVHQAQSVGQEPSLHLTVSTNRLNAWTDLLETCVNNGLEAASAAHLDFRFSLPRDIFHFMGLQHQDEIHEEIDDSLQARDQAAEQPDAQPNEKIAHNTDENDGDSIAEVAAASYDAELANGLRRQNERRAAFRDQIRRRLHQVLETCLNDSVLDAAVDDIALRFLADRQPPPRRKQRLAKLSHSTKLRPVSRRAARLVLDDESHQALLYHSLDNGRTHREKPIACLEFEIDDAPAIETLLAAHIARPVLVSDLPHASLDEKLQLAQTLYDEGLFVAVDDDQEPDDELADEEDDSDDENS